MACRVAGPPCPASPIFALDVPRNPTKYRSDYYTLVYSCLVKPYDATYYGGQARQLLPARDRHRPAHGDVLGQRYRQSVVHRAAMAAGIRCPHCDSDNVQEKTARRMPPLPHLSQAVLSAARPLQESKLPYRTSAIAIFMIRSRVGEKSTSAALPDHRRLRLGAAGLG